MVLYQLLLEYLQFVRIELLYKLFFYILLASHILLCKLFIRFISLLSGRKLSVIYILGTLQRADTFKVIQCRYIHQEEQSGNTEIEREREREGIHREMEMERWLQQGVRNEEKERRQRINYKRLHINANLTTEAVQATSGKGRVGTDGRTDRQMDWQSDGQRFLLDSRKTPEAIVATTTCKQNGYTNDWSCDG